MTIQAEHEAAFNRLPLKPGTENYIIDAESGVVSRATVWLHGAIWFFDHYDQSHPAYAREYEHAARQPATFWRPRVCAPSMKDTDMTKPTMSDLVERLRDNAGQDWSGGCQGCYRTVMDEAADEIERLRAALEYYASGIAGRGDIARHVLKDKP